MKTETKMIGILMTARDVPKVMDGSKTQLRLIIKNQPPEGVSIVGPEIYAPTKIDKYGEEYPGDDILGVYDLGGEWGAKVDYRPGDILYVKEALKESIDHDGTWARYKTDNLMVITRGGYRRWQSDDGTPWKNKVIPARYMPRSAARTFIEITDVRCERIQDITESDAKAEGANRPYGRSPDAYDKYGTPEGIGFSYKLGFQKLWNDTNGKGAWERNDWVFAYTFKLVGVPQ